MAARFALVALLAVACAHRTPPPPASPPPPNTVAVSEYEDDPPLEAVLMNSGKQIFASPPDWGLPISGGTTEVRTALAAVGSGQAKPSDLTSSLVIGPALWAILVKLDPALAAVGTTSINDLPHKVGQTQSLEMRSFSDEVAQAALLRSAAFQKIGRGFAQGNVHAASDADRHLFYVLVPFEIAGRAVTIAERGVNRLVVFLDDRNRLAWLDVLSAFGPAGSAP